MEKIIVSPVPVTTGRAPAMRMRSKDCPRQLKADGPNCARRRGHANVANEITRDWQSGSDGRCQPSSSYMGPCRDTMDFTSYNVEMSEAWSSSCGAFWACLE